MRPLEPNRSDFQRWEQVDKSARYRHCIQASKGTTGEICRRINTVHRRFSRYPCNACGDSLLGYLPAEEEVGRHGSPSLFRQRFQGSHCLHSLTISGAVHMSVVHRVENMSEDQFQNWVQNQMHTMGSNRLRDPRSMEHCGDLLQEWSNQRDEASAHEQALQEILKSKRGLREQLMTALANLSRPQKAGPRTTSGARFRSPGRHVAGKSRSTVPAPSSAPLVHILTPALCQHVIMFTHSGARGSQPVGSSGAEIYIAVCEQPPVDQKAFRFAAWATRSPHVLQFSEADAGRTAHYRLRWINAKGEAGPWSDMVTAVIPAMESAEIAA